MKNTYNAVKQLFQNYIYKRLWQGYHKPILHLYIPILTVAEQTFPYYKNHKVIFFILIQSLKVVNQQDRSENYHKPLKRFLPSMGKLSGNYLLQYECPS